MGGRLARSSGVSSTLTLRRAAPSRAALDLETLYRSSRDDLYAYAVTLLRDRTAAEEVVAVAFERAYRKRGAYRPERGSPRAWLFAIARHAALDELRRRGRSASLTEDAVSAEAACPEDEAERAVRRAAVRAALAELPPRDREVIALRFHAGLDTAELAGILGISATNAGTLLHRALKKLREALDVR